MRTPDLISPLSLLQEELCHDPWKMLIACKMLNCTGYKQVRRVIWAFFDAWPTPEAAAAAEHDEMADVIRSLGFYNRRTKQIKRMSREYAEMRWTDPRDIHGVGDYARDSWTIFIERSLDVKPSDHKLKEYLAWAITTIETTS